VLRTVAGSTITEDVPPNPLASARSPQITKPEWVKERGRAKPPAAKATKA
jgi:bifunctional N-acetylglucosamine-1-phosphate-uridyltransferase/glucosamine-1-phosphate-acetyltransferase GlmU-like protein